MGMLRRASGKAGILSLPILAALAVLVSSPLILAAPALADSSLKIDNAILKIEVSPGENLTHVMIISSGPDAPPMDILVEAAGFGQNLSGANVELAAEQDDSPRSARGFIANIDSPAFHLEPGASQRVEVAINVPDDLVAGTSYAIIYVHSLPAGEGSVGMVVAADVPVLLTAKGSDLETIGTITDLSVAEVVSGEPLEVVTLFENTGNHHYKIKNEITITGGDGQVIASGALPLSSASIIPTYARELRCSATLTVGGLAVGTYNAGSTVMLEDGTILDSRQTSFTVSEAYEMFPCLDPDTMVVTHYENEEPYDIDARDRAGLEVAFTDTGVVSGTVTLGRCFKDCVESTPARTPYSAPEGDGGTGGEALGYMAVGVDGFSGGMAQITVGYHSGDLAGHDEKGLYLAYWDGEYWKICANLSVYDRADTVSGDIPVMVLKRGAVIGLGWGVLEPEAAEPVGEVAETDEPPVGVSLPWIITGIAVCGLVPGIIIYRRKRRS